MDGYNQHVIQQMEGENSYAEYIPKKDGHGLPNVGGKGLAGSWRSRLLASPA
jgi:hypothetical protein